MGTRALNTVAACAAIVLGLPASAWAYLSTHNISPFPSSTAIVGASWTSPRYGPPSNQFGDILPTIWADDGDQYAMVDDGGTDIDVPGAIWKQSLTRIAGTPPGIRFSHVGDPKSPPPSTYAQIHAKGGLWQGPLGPYYSSGLVMANHVLFATQENDWNWHGNGPFAGLHGIAYSEDHGQHWSEGGKQFPAPLGNLSWVIRGQGGVYPDGYVYAIASEREFNASRLILGRARPDVKDMTDPADWEWVTGWVSGWPVFSSNIGAAVAVVNWPSHLTYPQMAYDAPLHRYLLTFSYSYATTVPDIWTNGAELLILEAPHPWGPFSFVAHEPEFGPSNGYAAGFPIKWISANGQDLWLKWSANFAGCRTHLDCSGGYGFNFRRLHFTVAGRR